MLELFSKVTLVVSSMVIFLWSLFFYRQQNHKCAMGGKISKPKIVWLCLAIYIYFPLTTILALEKNVPWGFQKIFISIAILMWLRAAGELYLLYGIKKWSPKIGIGHNIVCLLTILLQVILFRSSQANSFDCDLVLGLISLCLIIDSYYAYQFRKIVHGHTKGSDGIWFADEEQERFRAINKITNQWNWVVSLGLMLFLWRNF